MRMRVLVALLGAMAASLPARSHDPRPVVSCNIGGETVFTDLSCAEAKQIADALSPPSRPRSAVSDARGTNPESLPASVGGPAYYAVALDLPSKRFAYGRNPECPHLEQRMALVEAEGRSAMSSETMRIVEERLSVQQSWYRQLGC